MNKKFKFTSAVLSAGLFITPVSGLVNHYDNVAKANEINKNIINISKIKLNKKDKIFYDKIIKLSKHFYFDENNKLQINLSEKELKSKLNNYEYEILKDYILNTYIPKNENKSFSENKIHVSSGKLYISNSDLKGGIAAGLVVAAEAGPAALAAALATLGTLTGGPVGSLIATIYGVIGGASLATLAGMIVWAVAHDQGIYIGVEWTVPPIVMGYW